MNYHAIIVIKQNMQGEKATFLPRQTVVVLPQIAALDLPLTSCRLCYHTSKNKHQTRKHKTVQKKFRGLNQTSRTKVYPKMIVSA